MAKPKVYIGVDIVPNLKANQRLDMRHPETYGRFLYADSRHVKIMGRTDLLFIDTFHNASTLTDELIGNAHNVNKYIVLHDTETFGLVGEDGTKGIRFAMDDYLKGNDDWHILEHYPNCNGLTVLERVSRASN